MIPTDDRKHDPKKAIDSTYFGYIVGRWEGDTPMLDSNAIEKLTRKGNKILYQVTVDDPEVLVQPWAMTPRTPTLSTFPDVELLREPGHRLPDSALVARVGSSPNNSRWGGRSRGRRVRRPRSGGTAP